MTFKVSYDITEGEIERGLHVHHATVLRILERGRNRFLEELDCSESWFLSQNLLPVISSISVKYLRELFIGPVEISCSSGRLEEKSIIVAQSIINQKGKCAVQADVEYKVLSLDSRRAVAPPAQFIRAFSSVFGAS